MSGVGFESGPILRCLHRPPLVDPCPLLGAVHERDAPFTGTVLKYIASNPYQLFEGKMVVVISHTHTYKRGAVYLVSSQVKPQPSHPIFSGNPR